MCDVVLQFRPLRIFEHSKRHWMEFKMLRGQISPISPRRLLNKEKFFVWRGLNPGNYSFETGKLFAKLPSGVPVGKNFDN